jgi:mRNA-degrading endonuclease RelE of RelBE toxin-antitoxin system
LAESWEGNTPVDNFDAIIASHGSGLRAEVQLVHCITALEHADFDAAQDFGYNLARMRFEIILAPEAVDDFRSLRANIRSTVRDALETHLRYDPTKTSRSRIKRLRGLERPQYRLRVGEVRIFYDVSAETVEVLAIVHKSEAAKWLEQFGKPA